ncbi:hypothetical protein PhCBS80983_g06230 [Powellomyces hirtus]|uniref:SF3 helicase domain-containing protein n=1 Tax=Powellomyces hirtus TaxID=109895 RepID=A0A507DQK2_9FUNG|nr:hypothetical protein PhCBS80983_g06230 [Powellomyces hirtus]
MSELQAFFHQNPMPDLSDFPDCVQRYNFSAGFFDKSVHENGRSMCFIGKSKTKSDKRVLLKSDPEDLDESFIIHNVISYPAKAEWNGNVSKIDFKRKLEMEEKPKSSKKPKQDIAGAAVEQHKMNDELQLSQLTDGENSLVTNVVIETFPHSYYPRDMGKTQKHNNCFVVFLKTKYCILTNTEHNNSIPSAYFVVSANTVNFKCKICDKTDSKQHKSEDVKNLLKPQDCEELKDCKRKPSHMSLAVLLKKLFDDTCVFDGCDFWLFLNKWNVVTDTDIRVELKTRVNPIFHKWELELQLEKQHLAGKLKEDKDDALRVLKSKITACEKALILLTDNGQIGSIVNCLKTEVYESKFLDKADSDPFIVGCNNGYIHLRDGLLHPYTKDIIVTRTVGFDYFADDVQPDDSIRNAWKHFTEQIFPVPEEREAAQIAAGYCLRGDHPEKVIFVFTDKSNGDNGKSKFTQALQAAIGGYTKSGNENHIYEESGYRNQNSHNSSLFTYVKTRLAVFEEIGNTHPLDTKKAKAEHGGNCSKVARAPNAKVDVTIQFCTKWILIFNPRCQPKYDTTDVAFVKRLVVFPFRAKFFKTMDDMTKSEELYKFLANPDVADIFPTWRPYILEWMLAGYKRYEEKKFNSLPASCNEWKSDVTKAVINLSDWIEDNLVKYRLKYRLNYQVNYQLNYTYDYMNSRSAYGSIYYRMHYESAVLLAEQKPMLDAAGQLLSEGWSHQPEEMIEQNFFVRRQLNGIPSPALLVLVVTEVPGVPGCFSNRRVWVSKLLAKLRIDSERPHDKHFPTLELRDMIVQGLLTFALRQDAPENEPYFAGSRRW